MYHKRNDKKGQVGILAKYIILIASAIVLFLFISMFVNKTNFDQSIHACRLSVIAQMATQINPMSLTGTKSFLDINCDKRYINFHNTKVELGLNPTNMKPRPINVENGKVNRFKELTDFTVDQVIAEEMRICKYEFVDGKEDIFVNNDYVRASKDVCFICSEIRFKDVKKTSFDTLLDYTKKTTFDPSRVTYYDYLTDKTMYNMSMWIQPFFDKTEPYGNLSIDTSKAYLVIVKKYSFAKWKNWPHTGLLGIAQDISYLFTSKDDLAPLTIAIIPMSDINKYCDVQAS